MVDLVATKDAPYGGRIRAGDSFSVGPRHAKILVSLGQATYAEPKKAKKAKAETTEDMPKGQYMRRDMTAQTERSVAAPPTASATAIPGMTTHAEISGPAEPKK